MCTRAHLKAVNTDYGDVGQSTLSSGHGAFEVPSRLGRLRPSSISCFRVSLGCLGLEHVTTCINGPDVNAFVSEEDPDDSNTSE